MIASQEARAMDREAELYTKEENNTVVCGLCHHRCRLAPGKTGVCRVRRNDDGRLVSLV
jgi:pyruvate formate lyase activating enzyme